MTDTDTGSATERVKFKETTSWDELFTEVRDGITTSMFRVGVPEDPDAPTVFKTYFPPNFRVEPHSHTCDYAEIILEGSQQVTRKWHHPGEIRIVKAGTVYGPSIAGPEGATVLLIFSKGDYAPVSPGGGSGAFGQYLENLPPISG